MAAGHTAYHFQPAKNWQNDPNGPMYHNGMYHFFFQYNPYGPSWGNISWGHSVSGDLVNWTAVDTALVPDSPFDVNGCCSGSATVLPGGRPALLYTGLDANNKGQVQNVAFAKNPSDPLLVEWDKSSCCCNPVIPTPADVTGDNFRDPTEAWRGRDGLWRVGIAAEVHGVGCVLVYRSADFIRWERNAAPLHASRKGAVLECPDLFPVLERGSREGLDASASGPGVRHVLKLSDFASEDHYMVGRYEYDDGADVFVPDEAGRGVDCAKWRRLDHGHLYAAKSFFDARKKRRVLWAWVDEADGVANDVAKGWAGIQICDVQTFPRAIWLDSDGKQLVQWPVEEIETLRKKRVGLEGSDEVKAGEMREIAGIVASQADVEVVFEIPNLEDAETLDPDWLLDPQKLCREKGAFVGGGVGPFGLLVMASSDLQEHTAVFFRVFKHHVGEYKVFLCTDLTRSSRRADAQKPAYGVFVDVDDVDKDRRLSLRTLIDHTVVECFGVGGRTCITARVYPEHAATSSSSLWVFNNGSGAVKVSKLDAWELRTAAVN